MGLINDFKEKGYSNLKLPHPELLTLKETAWKELLDLPPHEKEKIGYSQEFDCGYEIKKKGKSFDEKENIHFLLNDYVRLKEIAASMPSYAKERLDKYIEVSKEFMYKNYIPLMKSIADELNPYLDFDMREGIDFLVGYWIQRDLGYIPVQDINVDLAKAHLDVCFLTFGIFSSVQGLEVYVKSENDGYSWKPLSFRRGEAFVMPGRQCQLLTQSEIRATPHRVVNSSGSMQHGRRSGVCFTYFPHLIQAKSKTTTKRETGYNLDCTHAEYLKREFQ